MAASGHRREGFNRMPKEIEPDGQQFLDARADDARSSESETGEMGETTPLEPKRSLALPIAVAIGAVIVLAGVVGFFVLVGDDGDTDLTGVATRGDVEVRSERDNKVATTTTTTSPDDTTTTAPPTTAPPSTTAPPQTVFVTPQTVIVPGQPAPQPSPRVIQSCPGGSVATQMSGSSFVDGKLTAAGTATSYFSTPMNVTVTLVLSNGGRETVTIRPNPVPALGTATWEFTGYYDPEPTITVTNLTGSFTFADSSYAHCPGGSIG